MGLHLFDAERLVCQPSQWVVGARMAADHGVTMPASPHGYILEIGAVRVNLLAGFKHGTPSAIIAVNDGHLSGQPFKLDSRHHGLGVANHVFTEHFHELIGGELREALARAILLGDLV